jgi:pyridoxal phosphate enzyme (YggS family)
MSVADRLEIVRANISNSCNSCGRDAVEVTLIAVSKTVPLSALQEAWDAGQRHFGESRLQEAQPKIDALPVQAEWHFIGNLQSNKAKKIGQTFDVIHSLYSEAQLKELAKCDRPVRAFIEVNIAQEPQKGGVFPHLLDEFVQVVLNYSQVQIQGLMTVGPIVENPEDSRQYFRELKRLNDRLGFSKLSMGMSQDYEVAIQEGATHIRVGSAIFGSRQT